jgi:hypothetical protein
MSLSNVSYCRYLTKGPWSQDKHNAYNIVRAIKGDSFNGYADLKIGSVWKRLTSESPQIAFEWFAENVKSQTKFAKETTYYLCPIPDSQCTSGCGRPPKTIALAQALVSRLPQLVIWDSLRFSKVMPKSSLTNMRNEEVIFQALRCPSPIPDGHIILLDDVCTSGSHAKASARRLGQAGADSVSAMSVARTTQNSADALFGFRSDPL